jgi:hypothetical protein
LHLAGKIKATSTIDKIEIIKFDGDKYRVFYKKSPKNKLDFHFVILDKTVKKGDFYYLKVRQKDGNLGWSSPVWIQ